MKIGDKVLIVGLGGPICSDEDFVCVLTGEPATGYIENEDYEMVPCNLNAALGPGRIGGYAEIIRCNN